MDLLNVFDVLEYIYDDIFPLPSSFHILMFYCLFLTY